MERFQGSWTRFCSECEETVLEIFIGAANARKIANSRKYIEIISCAGGAAGSVTVTNQCEQYQQTTVAPLSVVPSAVKLNGAHFDVTCIYECDSDTFVIRKVSSNGLIEVTETRKLYEKEFASKLLEVVTVVQQTSEEANARTTSISRRSSRRFDADGRKVAVSRCIQWFCDEQADPELSRSVDTCFTMGQRPFFDLKAPPTAFDDDLDAVAIAAKLAAIGAQPLCQYLLEFEIFGGFGWVGLNALRQLGTNAHATPTDHHGSSNRNSSNTNASLIQQLPLTQNDLPLSQWSISKRGCTSDPLSEDFRSLREAQLFDFVFADDEYEIFREFSFVQRDRSSILGWELIETNALGQRIVRNNNSSSSSSSSSNSRNSRNDKQQQQQQQPTVGQLRRRLWMRIILSRSQLDALGKLISDTVISINSGSGINGINGAAPVLYRGVLWKRGDVFTGWRKRMFVLREDCLYYYNIDGASAVLRGSFSLRNATVLILSPNNCFERMFGIGLILSNGKTRYLSAADAQQQIKWVQLLSKVITLISDQTIHLPSEIFPFSKCEIILSGELYLEGRERNDWILCFFKLSSKKLTYQSAAQVAFEGSFDISTCVYTDSPTEICEFLLQSIAIGSSDGVLNEQRNVLHLLAPDEMTKATWRHAIRMVIKDVQLCTFLDLDDEHQTEQQQYQHEIHEILSDTTEQMGITSASSVTSASVAGEESDNDNSNDNSAVDGTTPNRSSTKKKSKRKAKAKSVSFVSSFTKSLRRVSLALGASPAATVGVRPASDRPTTRTKASNNTNSVQLDESIGVDIDHVMDGDKVEKVKRKSVGTATTTSASATTAAAAATMAAEVEESAVASEVIALSDASGQPSAKRTASGNGNPNNVRFDLPQNGSAVLRDDDEEDEQGSSLRFGAQRVRSNDSETYQESNNEISELTTSTALLELCRPEDDVDSMSNSINNNSKAGFSRNSQSALLKASNSSAVAPTAVLSEEANNMSSNPFDADDESVQKVASNPFETETLPQYLVNLFERENLRPEKIFHGVWTLKKFAGELIYRKRFVWIDPIERTLNWAKSEDDEARCKGLPLSVAIVEQKSPIAQTQCFGVSYRGVSVRIQLPKPNVKSANLPPYDPETDAAIWVKVMLLLRNN